jgi:hypothetical protein
MGMENFIYICKDNERPDLNSYQKTGALMDFCLNFQAEKSVISSASSGKSANSFQKRIFAGWTMTDEKS